MTRLVDRRKFLMGLLASLAARGAAVKHPNAVLIVAPSWSGEVLNTPTLTSFAGQSSGFSRAYAADPAEWPAMAALLTGLFPHATGITSPARALIADLPSLAGTLRSAGYATAYFGPWQLGREGPRGRGFDFAGAPDPEALAGFLKSVRKPLFAVVHWSAAAGLSYSGDLARADALFGQMLGAIHARIGDGGVTLFTSDRGELAGSFVERSTRVPMFVRYPGRIKPGDASDFLISQVDVMPTLLALCGVEIPGGLHGRNLAPALLAGSGDRPDSIYAEGAVGEADAWRMMVYGWDKLVTTPNGTPLHLYNLADDELETVDIVRDASQRVKVDALTTLIRMWMRKTEDGVYPSGLKKR
jgi:arylsulfatase A-like enzyme